MIETRTVGFGRHNYAGELDCGIWQASLCKRRGLWDLAGITVTETRTVGFGRHNYARELDCGTWQA